MRFFLVSFCVLSAYTVFAQNEDASGAYSPYSFYGIGDIKNPGFAYNRAMGGIGYGVRTNRVINHINPAALTVQDSSSFMFDFGGELQNYYISSSTQSTAANSFNISHLAFSFPIWKKTSMVGAVAVMPYSHVGYDITRRETDPQVIVETGDAEYSYKGEGGLNQMVLSYAAKIGKHLSLGTHAHLIFGSIDRYYNILVTSGNMQNIYNSTSMKVGSFAFTLGAQYEKSLEDDYHLVLGANYQFRNNMKVTQSDYSYVSTSLGTDTIHFSENTNAPLLVPGTVGLGMSLRKGLKWQAGIDYTYRDWSDATFTTPSDKHFTATSSHAVCGGFEYTPNINDIRYYIRRISYRAGLYYESTYMQFGDTKIKDYGVTFGAGIPLGRYNNNTVNMAVELGQRGTTKGGLLKEFYWKVSASISLYDIWFQKIRFD